MTHAANKLILVMVVCLSPFLMINQVSADAMPIVHSSDTERGHLLFEQGGVYRLAPTLKTQVDMNITGLVARVKVAQVFSNPTEHWLNAVYTFPLPEKSAVDRLKMHVGERVIEGKIESRQKAKKVFAAAKRSGKKATLIEQQRTNVFRNNIANIAPGETIEVLIEYQQTLDYNMGEFSIRFPMVVAPRYVPNLNPVDGFSADGWATSNTKDTEQESHPNAQQAKVQHQSLNSPIKAPGDKSHDVSIHVALDSGFMLDKLESDFHPIDITEITTGSYDIYLNNGTTLANRDFVLRWRPMPNEIPQGAFFTQQVNGENYGLLMVIPPIEQSAQVMSKEVVFVIDTSGSMSGESITQAKAALLSGIERLNVGDRFNVVAFSQSASSLYSRSMPVNDANKAMAREFIYHLQAEGGTNIAEALLASLPRTTDESMVRQVVFVTDGSVSNEEELFNLINAQLGDSRLFTVGIGSAPNSRFMRGAARLGRGTYTYIGDTFQVKKQMGELLQKLASPVLSDIELVDASGVNLADMSVGTVDYLPDYWPNPIADLYLGEPLMVSLKLPSDMQNLTIKGKLADNEWQMALPLGAGSNGADANGLDVLWARNKITSLSENARNAKQRVLNEQLIEQLGLQYHLVTRYTSLVAVDVTPVKSSGEEALDTKVANHLPHGWTSHKPHGQLPQGATSAPLRLLMGILLLLMAFGFYRYQFRGHVNRHTSAHINRKVAL